MRVWLAALVVALFSHGSAAARSIIHTVAPDSARVPDFDVVFDCEASELELRFTVLGAIAPDQPEVVGDLLVAGTARAALAWDSTGAGRRWAFCVSRAALPQTVFAITLWAGSGMPAFTQWRFDLGALFPRSFTRRADALEPEDAPVDSVALALRASRDRDGVPEHWELRLGPGSPRP